jgi:hypothetical protein
LGFADPVAQMIGIIAFIGKSHHGLETVDGVMGDVVTLLGEPSSSWHRRTPMAIHRRPGSW